MERPGAGRGLKPAPRRQPFTTPPQITYQVLHDPIDLNLNSRNAFRASVKYRGKPWEQTLRFGSAGLIVSFGF